MLVDNALRDAAKHASPTTIREKNSKTAYPEKVPYRQAPSESRKPKFPPIVIDVKLKTTSLLKTFETHHEKRIMGEIIPGKRLKYSLKRLKTT
ncbi:hypothetical protein AVEN_95917-1 [Araneus ventricosus]|uniref:Uncharacterized protein n=1 Tax=Araneus ventricosus TaxID=182803 RepID=A0A4Y2TJK0_ARAVE|nr:hypothetical protein AVEN_95917-1 [Araneus ventricosus]